jgi:hypothetical protein
MPLADLLNESDGGVNAERERDDGEAEPNSGDLGHGAPVWTSKGCRSDTYLLQGECRAGKPSEEKK